MRALLLDLGGTVFRSGSEMMALLADAEPAVRGVVARCGPLGPEHDALWDSMIGEEITERAYWQHRSDEVGTALGRPGWSIQEFMHVLYGLAGDDIIRPSAAALIAIELDLTEPDKAFAEARAALAVPGRPA
jgi:putative hydrolase of the HAD superfamily